MIAIIRKSGENKKPASEFCKIIEYYSYFRILNNYIIFRLKKVELELPYTISKDMLLYIEKVWI